MYKELKEKFDVNCGNVDKLLQSPQNQIVSKFLSQSMSVEKILKVREKINIECKLDIQKDVQWLKKPVIENSFNNMGNFQIKWPTSIKAVGLDLLVYSDNNTSKCVVFDNKGTVIRSFNGLKDHGNAKCVEVYKNCLYLAQRKQIICLSNFNTLKERSFTFMPKMNSLYKMAVATGNVLICTDSDEGKVFEYNTKDDTTKMVLQRLRYPTYISVAHTPQGTRYILTLSLSVKIYDETWHPLTTITQGIDNPLDTVPCSGGFLLADWGSNKITLYSYTGYLVRTVLTEQDGLSYPISLTIRPPYIWVGHGSYGDCKITCFRVY